MTAGTSPDISDTSFAARLHLHQPSVSAFLLGAGKTYMIYQMNITIPMSDRDPATAPPTIGPTLSPVRLPAVPCTCGPPDDTYTIEGAADEVT